MSDLFGNHIVGFPMRRLMYFPLLISAFVYISAFLWENQQCSFRTGQTQTGLYKHRILLETGNFGFRKQRDCTIRVAKTKALISFAVTAKLICAFVFAYADCWFSHGAAHLLHRQYDVHVVMCVHPVSVLDT